MADLRERIRATKTSTAAAVLMLAGGWAALTRQGSEVAGVSFWEAFDHRGPVASAIQATRFGREFGRGIDLAAIFCVCAARRVRRSCAAAAWAPRRSPSPRSPWALWTIVVPGLSGHAGDPGLGALTIAVDALHVGASAVWIGGLAQLVLVVPHATRGLADAARDRARREALGRFSTLALGSVVVIAATGAGRALWEVGAVSQVWSTGYGRTLIAKSVLFAGLIALGYRNRHALDRFWEVRRRAVAELALLAGVLAAVSLLTDLQPASTPGFAAVRAAPSGGPALGAALAARPACALARRRGPERDRRARRRAARLNPGADRRPGTVSLDRAPDGTFVGTVPSSGQPAQHPRDRGPADMGRLGADRRRPPHAAGRRHAGGDRPVAAEQASDLAVGLQRTSAAGARVTVLAPSGAALPTALVLVDGHVALPCPGAKGVCFSASAPRGPRPIPVQVRRPGQAPVTAIVRLPPIHAPVGKRLLGRQPELSRPPQRAGAERARVAPRAPVTTNFVVQAPDRVAFSVRGGASARIIGTTRWDREPGRDWVRSPAPRSRVPDAFWAPGAEAVYVAGGDRETTQLTLVLPAGPTFFRLWIDRSTQQVVRLRMITAAHFMSEREFDQNTAPPIVPPA